MKKQRLLTAIIERLKPNAKGSAEYDWISFAKAVSEVAEALSIPHEVAQMTLVGLIATGDISASNAKGLIDLDETTIAELRIDQAAAGELRGWLREHSKAPLVGQRDFVIAKLLRNGAVPARSVTWKEFCDKVRNECNGWQGKGAKRMPAWGFDHKTIQRQVAKLTRR